MAEAISQAKDAQDSKVSEIRELSAKITELIDTMAQIKKANSDKENSLRA